MREKYVQNHNKRSKAKAKSIKSKLLKTLNMNQFSDCWSSNFVFRSLEKQHCVKRVRIQSFSGPYFPAYRVSLRIQSEFGKMRTRKTPYTEHFSRSVVFKSGPILMATVSEIWSSTTLHKKWSFQLRISSVNVTKSEVSCVFYVFSSLATLKLIAYRYCLSHTEGKCYLIFSAISI